MIEETIRAPKRHLCPVCISMAESFQGYLKHSAQYEREDRLLDGHASPEEMIRYVWDKWGKGRQWPEGDHMVIAAMLPQRLSVAMERARLYAEHQTTMQMDHYHFDRAVSRYRFEGVDITTTRVSCAGITVEEHIHYGRP